jgi:DNA-binding HxlR family transcriptional regulator
VARTYDDPCGLARALNLVGDRWALLIVRELLLGPKRFTQLRRGLPGASQSMLTGRLTDLEDADVLRRVRLGPPTSAAAYELTPHGRALEPALLALATWGSHTPRTSEADLSVDALALAMRTTFTAPTLTARGQLRLDDDELSVTTSGGHVTITRGQLPAPDLTVTTTATTWRSLIFGGASLAAAERTGTATVTGDHDLAERLVAAFPRPAPHDT